MQGEPRGEEAAPARGHGLLASFGFAWDGLVDGAIRDRNLRIHLALGVLVGAFAGRAWLAPSDRALLLVCIALVIAAESFNSALEAAVDLASPGRDERARFAKDAAAAAVLAVAAGSVLVFLAVAGHPGSALGWRELAAQLRHAGLTGWPGAGALAAAVAAGVLPSPLSRARAASAVLGMAAVAGLVAVARGAASHAGTVAAALCVAVALGAARRRRRRAGAPR